jgi:hypothetical protein
MFDIVANFDLIQYIPQLVGNTRKFNIYVEKLIEGYTFGPDDSIRPTYSNMMKPKSDDGYMCSYYSNIIIPLNQIGDIYYDITELFDLRCQVTSKYEIMVVNKNSGQVVMMIMKGEDNKIFKGDSSIFVYISLRHRVFQVYSASVQYNQYKKKKFIFCKGCFFFWCSSKS